MIKILFLTHSLGGGGAERVLVNLVNHMDKTKFDITVETMFSDGVNRALLSDEVSYFCRKALCFPGITHLYQWIPAKLLYRYFVGNADYDIIVAFMHGIPAKVISGCRKSKAKKVSWLHYGEPSEGSFFDCWLSRSKGISVYQKMDALVGVSKTVSDAFSEYINFSKNTTTLYNTNDTNCIVTMSNEPNTTWSCKKRLTICTAGRLESQKGYDRLITAGKRLTDEHFQFDLVIMGSGSEESALKASISKYQLEDIVHLVGFCENPYAVMADSDIFISSSREEGLATVLTEALTVGLPVISTDVSGAKEVLGDNNEYGLVVENSTEGIYSGLKRFLTEPELAAKYRRTAKERAEIFDTAHTVAATEVFFEQLMNQDEK